MEIIINIGFRSFKVLLEDNGISALRSKVVKVSVTTAQPSLANIIQTSSLDWDVSRSNIPLPRRSTHQVHSDLKGKKIVSPIRISAKSVERSFGLDLPTKEREISDHSLVAPDRPHLP